MSDREERVQSIPGGGVGGAPPPGTGFASGTYPTVSHSATQISPNVPLDLNPVSSRTLIWWFSSDFRGGTETGRSVAGLQDRLHPRRLHERLRDLGPLPSLRGALWGTVKCSLVLAVLALAGCGGGGAGGEGDPASAVPPDALVYTEVVVRPEGSLRDDARDAAGKVLRTDDPDGEIRRLVDQAFEGEDFDYDRDVAPWLGERAGFWLQNADGDRRAAAGRDRHRRGARVARGVAGAQRRDRHRAQPPRQRLPGDTTGTPAGSSATSW